MVKFGKRFRGYSPSLPVTFFSFLVLFSFFQSCYATPTEADADRVRGRFLILRFYSTFNRDLRGLSDRELFEMSCRSNQVPCEPVLKIL